MVIDPTGSGYVVSTPKITFKFIKKYTGAGVVDMVPKRNQLLNINAFVSDRAHTDKLPVNTGATALLEQLGFEMDSVIDKTIRGSAVIASSLPSRPSLTQHQLLGLCVLCARQEEGGAGAPDSALVNIPQLFCTKCDEAKEEGEEEEEQEETKDDELEELFYDDGEVVEEDDDENGDTTTKNQQQKQQPAPAESHRDAADSLKPSSSPFKKRNAIEMSSTVPSLPSSSSSNENHHSHKKQRI